MNILVVVAVWLLLTCFFIFLSINSIFHGLVIPWSNLILFIVLWAGATILIILFIYLRKKSKKQTKQLFEQYKETPSSSYKDREYFYQTPLIIFNNQERPVYGKKDITYYGFFNNLIQKTLSLTGFFPLFGVKLNSDNHHIAVKRIKWWHIRPHFEVYWNDQKIGILFMKSLFSKKAIQQLPYKFKDSKKRNFDFNNPFFSHETIIKDPNGNKLLEARRSFFDLGKSNKTNQRGETHHLKTFENNYDYPDELWLALYIQVMITKQTTQ
ncbi:hypothetical protein MT340_001230 [Staphylococcus sp. NRL 16/872]|uniref:hypothetical protein n=1 Tax=Staphylococcus sp. NRL 16/872 TaxID=2930131 RepID=UPI001FB1D461|nr:MULTISPECIES: hypothetical protein [unclassified Staphylococcus]MCJ1655394.1 hypothetical protein [Staphylococcus sp. NRL 21/187]MCJ1661229.1 hypothetical protein [Staphylococcus sp. NRL 18/288]MCJ1667119.1 hypothetical protein [Staphylococcus sp. NRL 19/737]WEN69601.1 hypothetical protein MT340_001230 [Staphylococcus sp. NRL 16/872]